MEINLTDNCRNHIKTVSDIAGYVCIEKSYTLAKVVNLLSIFLTTGSIYFKWVPGLWLTKQKKMFYKSSAQNDLDFFLTNMLYKSVMLIRLVWKTNVFIGEILKINTWR